MIYDAVVLAILFVSALIAFFRGLIREILTITGVVGGAIAAVYLGPLLSPTIRNWVVPEKTSEDAPDKFMDLIPYPLLGDIISYSLIFVLFVIVLSVISHFLSAWVKSIGLGIADRILGVIFGLIRGILLISIFWLPVYLLVDNEERLEWGWVKDSMTVSYVERFVGYLEQFLPQETKEEIEEQAEVMEEKAKDKLQEMAVDKLNNNQEQKKDEQGYEGQSRDNLEKLIEDSINE